MQAPSPTRSIWSRFWSPSGMLERIPTDADAREAEDIVYRNDLWLKTYMDMYILRWGGLFLGSLVLAVLTYNDGIPMVFNAAFAALSVFALAGLAVMIRTYRRAAAAVLKRLPPRKG
ncbi:MAG: hypothetical protein J7549_06030 [Variovorax sp.]|nr:hypothetical protein [Variovorax sp.]